MVTIKCPKCPKTFTHPMYLSKCQDKLKSHLNPGRKNACDSVGPFIMEKNVTFTPPDIHSLDLTGLVESLNPHIRYFTVASFIFNKLNERNKFVVWPNTKIYEILYRQNGRTISTTPGKFLMVFWHQVIQDQVVPFLKQNWATGYAKWRAEIITKTSLDLLEFHNFQRGHINAFMKTDVYQDLKSAISGHLKAMTRAERGQLRVNMGSEQPAETFYISDTGGPRCNVPGCPLPLVERGACARHLLMMRPGDEIKIHERVEMTPEWKFGRNASTDFFPKMKDWPPVKDRQVVDVYKLCGVSKPPDKAREPSPQ